MGTPTTEHDRLAAILDGFAKDLDLDHSHPIDASAWFLGPKGENGKALKELIEIAARSQIHTREHYMPDDPRFTPSPDEKHEKAIGIIKTELKKLLDKLQGSIPLASYRNQSHMYWDLTLPGVAGYFAAMLYNQNNVAAEASPVTTLLEYQVGQDFCKMLFDPLEGVEGTKSKEDASWGHITCDGSVANGESMWAARNLKYLPVALAAAISVDPGLSAARCVTVKTCDGSFARLVDLSVWEQLNLPVDEVIGLVDQIVEQSGIEKTVIAHAVDTYSVQDLGMAEFAQRYLETLDQARPVVLTPATAH